MGAFQDSGHFWWWMCDDCGAAREMASSSASEPTSEDDIRDPCPHCIQRATLEAARDTARAATLAEVERALTGLLRGDRGDYDIAIKDALYELRAMQAGVGP